jgi:hypothetical protein
MVPWEVLLNISKTSYQLSRPLLLVLVETSAPFDVSTHSVLKVARISSDYTLTIIIY